MVVAWFGLCVEEASRGPELEPAAAGKFRTLLDAATAGAEGAGAHKGT